MSLGFLKFYNGILGQTSLNGAQIRLLLSGDQAILIDRRASRRLRLSTFARDRDRAETSFVSTTRSPMDVLLGAVAAVGHAIELVLIYVETHHWIFAFLAGGYVFYLHDRAVHARFDALEKRVDEVRKRLAVEL
ncbi:MAG TPA: hypothetical protein VE111_22650 [Bradyrhizobium sp.]|nr:hypothetical protein [Bradyrhizobium sp.]